MIRRALVPRRGLDDNAIAPSLGLRGNRCRAAGYQARFRVDMLVMRRLRWMTAWRDDVSAALPFDTLSTRSG